MNLSILFSPIASSIFWKPSSLSQLYIDHNPDRAITLTHDSSMCDSYALLRSVTFYLLRSAFVPDFSGNSRQTSLTSFCLFEFVRLHLFDYLGMLSEDAYDASQLVMIQRADQIWFSHESA